MAEIKLPKAEFNQGVVRINLNKYLPEEKKKKLANLSDEELAGLSPEELEEAKQVRANLLAIKQTTKEVDNMENQEKWTAAVQQFAQEHGLSVQEAEIVLKQKAGLGSTPTELGTLLAALKPEPSPIEKAVSEVIATRIGNIAETLLPGPPANAQAGSPQNALSEALKQAKAAGAQSLYLPDGTMVKLTPTPTTEDNNQQDSIVKNASAQIQKYVTDIIDTRMPGIFNPPPGAPPISNSDNPEVTKLFFEDKWKEADRKAQAARDQGRDGLLRDIAAVVGTAFSPEGYKKFQKLLSAGPGMIGAGGTETKTEGKMLKATCWQCMRVFPYEEGQDLVCPFCGQAQKVQCPGCEEVFIPQRRDKIVCPKCHAELQGKPPEQGKSPEKEVASPESPGPISVGPGVLE